MVSIGDEGSDVLIYLVLLIPLELLLASPRLTKQRGFIVAASLLALVSAVKLGFELAHKEPSYYDLVGVAPGASFAEIKRGYKTRPGVVERPLLERMFLHVARLAWPDRDGHVHTVEACLPPELDLVLSKLRSFAPRHRN